MTSNVYHDAEYVVQISYKLERFKQKDRLKWNFRCPYCGDSQKSSIKARGYLLEGDRGLYFHCYNCDKKASFGKFLKHLDPGTFSRYQTDRYRPKKEELNLEDLKVDFEVREKKEKKVIKKHSGLFPITSLKKDHIAVKYLEDRKIPEKYWEGLFFTSKLDTLFGQRQKPVEPRIVLPCNTPEGDTFAYQGRILPDYDGLRYTIVKIDEELPLVFGLDRIDFSKTINVVEGPIDSFFLKNCMAVCCANLACVETLLNAHGVSTESEVVLIYDNERRNPDIVKRMLKAVKAGFSICIWPDWIEQKDVNLMVMKGIPVKKVIRENTYSGLSASLKIKKWMRCDFNRSFNHSELTW